MVMLVTSRETQRWIIPKGWAEKGVEPAAQAATEALEEAGLVGTVEPTPFGRYRYKKLLRHNRRKTKAITCTVDVYLLHVERQLDDWKEKSQRVCRWLDPTLAASLVSDKDLGPLILRVTDPAG